MSIDRRRFIVASAALGSTLLVAAQAQDAKPKTRVILLGTKGGPRVGGTGRKNPSTLLMINDQPYLVDCGYGCSQQMVAAKVALPRLRDIFITHNHSDHMLEYGGVIYNAWAAGLKTKVEAFGPPGLARSTQAFFEYMKQDIDIRIADEGRPDLRGLVAVHELDKPGAVMRNADVSVTSALVRHPPFTHAYAYRFDAADRSVVISGDTAYAPELAEFARGADVLVHEVMYLPGVEALLARNPNAATLREHLLASHTLTEDVGRIAAQAGVKTLVLSHLVPGDDPSITDAQWKEGVSKHYKGEIILAQDMMVI
jgi:ribonuclease BN (tRNA processing enzyme)